MTAPHQRLLIGLLLAASLAPAGGCVRRRLLVRSNPPGATVYVDNQPIGSTPCATSFTYYGTRELRLVKPGYETLTVKQPIPAPWYEFPGVDFVSENVVPQEIQDYRTVTYNLTPQAVTPPDQLLAKAEQLRAATQGGTVTPAVAVDPLAAPTLGPPTIVPATPGSVVPPGAEVLAPAPSLAPPPSTGAGSLPPGGVPLEPLPPPR